MTNTVLLMDTISNSGISIRFLSDAIGISRSAFYNKLDGSSEFKASEMFTLKQALHLDDDQFFRIFFAHEGE